MLGTNDLDCQLRRQSIRIANNGDLERIQKHSWCDHNELFVFSRCLLGFMLIK